ncbi:phenylacetate--CoA ligase family protein (plasmid) [Mycolicibacterium sp. ELW1]|uniref:phenylacetate--CoA ligase family protein n=1 Tax=Mycobacteriaceae TaxID=1762 RepID=UPI0011F066E6|nr:AMP-binding protein [Mycobacterium sp. ELW1]QEN17700.1 phenylacetate--CoA ligase [Mycobacterium sp. ELW1]
MESWEWPPRYDADYRPPLGQAHWFPVRETMDPELRDEAILERIRQLMAYAWERAPFYRKKWSQAGLEPGDITSLEAFEHVPVIRKEELRLDQAEYQPYGSYLCVDPIDVTHIKGTSGTTGRPTTFGINQLDWVSVANAHARVMWAMGIRPEDVMLIGSPLTQYWGSWGAYSGAERLGAAVFPFGAGVAGQSLRTLQWMRQMSATVFYGTPSYALRLAEVAVENDIDPRRLGLRKMFFSGEPGASVPAIRQRIIDAFDVEVYDSGSMAEVAPWMSLGAASNEPGVFTWQDLVYTEVCDPATTKRVPYGSEGTPVYTTLERTSQPMIRLLSNDLTRWEAPDASRGRTYPFLPKGVYGRIDDMFQIRGENIQPSAIDDVVMSAEGYGGEHRIVITREGTMDELLVQVEFDAQRTTVTQDIWVKKVGANLRTVLGVGAKVVAVAPATFERTDFKARRVIDDRKLFDSLEKEAQ